MNNKDLAYNVLRNGTDIVAARIDLKKSMKWTTWVALCAVAVLSNGKGSVVMAELLSVDVDKLPDRTEEMYPLLDEAMKYKSADNDEPKLWDMTDISKEW